MPGNNETDKKNKQMNQVSTQQQQQQQQSTERKPAMAFASTHRQNLPCTTGLSIEGEYIFLNASTSLLAAI